MLEVDWQEITYDVGGKKQLPKKPRHKPLGVETGT
jgi:hypothetical protein